MIFGLLLLLPKCTWSQKKPLVTGGDRLPAWLVIIIIITIIIVIIIIIIRSMVTQIEIRDTLYTACNMEHLAVWSAPSIIVEWIIIIYLNIKYLNIKYLNSPSAASTSERHSVLNCPFFVVLNSDSSLFVVLTSDCPVYPKPQPQYQLPLPSQVEVPLIVVLTSDRSVKSKSQLLSPSQVEVSLAFMRGGLRSADGGRAEPPPDQPQP
jgi:hypothetical protein